MLPINGGTTNPFVTVLFLTGVPAAVRLLLVVAVVAVLLLFQEDDPHGGGDDEGLSPFGGPPSPPPLPEKNLCRRRTIAEDCGADTAVAVILVRFQQQLALPGLLIWKGDLLTNRTVDDNIVAKKVRKVRVVWYINTGNGNGEEEMRILFFSGVGTTTTTDHLAKQNTAKQPVGTA